MRFFILGYIPQDNGNLLYEVLQNVLEEHRHIVPHRVNTVGSVFEITRENDVPKLVRNLDYYLFVRVVEGVDIVDIPPLLVVREDILREFVDIGFKSVHNVPPFDNSRTASLAVRKLSKKLGERTNCPYKSVDVLG